jgi:CubicO group peptidase (beta-lactamase class C family)
MHRDCINSRILRARKGSAPRLAVAVLALVLLATTACASRSASSVAAGKCAPVTSYVPTRGFRTNCPEALGLDSTALREGIDYVARHPATVAFLVVRRGYLVAERYFRGADEEVGFDTGSITKAVLGALIGVATHEGKLGSLDRPFLQCVDSAAAVNDSTLVPWRGVTLHHLLTMRAGYANDSTGRGGFATMAGLLRRPLLAPPGERAEYDHGSYHLASACLWVRTGGTLVRYANARLFEPMGEEIGYFDWDADDQDIEWGHTGLRLRPRALAKFGLLYAREGHWGDRVLVPATWIDATTSVAGEASDTGRATFAHGWWRRVMGGTRVYYAEGVGGQLLAVMPDLEIVVVVVSDPQVPGGLSRGERLLEQFILRAARDTAAAPSR